MIIVIIDEKVLKVSIFPHRTLRFLYSAVQKSYSTKRFCISSTSGFRVNI